MRQVTETKYKATHRKLRGISLKALLVKKMLWFRVKRKIVITRG